MRIHRIMLGRLGQVGHLVHRDAALDAGDRLACGGNLLRILQIVECGAHDDVDQLVLTSSITSMASVKLLATVYA